MIPKYHTFAPGQRFTQRGAIRRDIRLVGPTGTTNGTVLRSPAWECLVLGLGHPTRIQEHTLRRGWEIVEVKDG
jgi:hypothetical protein